MTPDESSATVDRPVEEAWSLVDRAAAEWGAERSEESDRSRLVLPVRAGLRQGWAEVEIMAEEQGEETRLRLREGASTYRLQIPAVIVLLASAAGGIVAAAWPFFPSLIPLAPFGAILALSGWFLVISRLKTSRPSDFLRTIELLAQSPGTASR